MYAVAPALPAIADAMRTDYSTVAVDVAGDSTPKGRKRKPARYAPSGAFDLRGAIGNYSSSEDEGEEELEIVGED